MRTIELPVTMEWTPEMLESLPREYRYEVIEGRLIMAAAAMRAWHGRTLYRVLHLLTAQGLEAYPETGLVVGPGEVYSPDVGVLRDPSAPQIAYHPAREFELVVEIVSPDSRTADRITKPLKYADAGIPEYWRVEEDDDGEAVVYQHRLVREAGVARYAEARVVLLSTLEKESL
ncbi:Uma2 family endonuclease [Phytohabitans sp. ZYX-F-186]|uniref:Uma2 family endonuclease n=1 Tax=Phytohabitans maris TaxID=3071409 RepID=A0ABU0ZJG0_9ACTN|nr:Uma2 family endonuclease [Phytohabitans sp. ZYX-F-186]MDQ7907103.1 Uma2 family endonuclease [Phytohabitans sp. ZYX-F-186]